MIRVGLIDVLDGRGQVIKRDSRGVTESNLIKKNYSNCSASRLSEMKQILEELRIENETIRVRCEICGNRVKPDLMEQHQEAYHQPVVVAA